MNKGPDRHAARRELVGGSGALALRNVLQGLLNIVRTKVVAVMLGPAGAGILSQATQFRFFVSRFVYLGFGPGIAKYTAERHAREDWAGVASLLNGVTTFFLITGGTLIVLVTGAAQPVSKWIFADPHLWRYALLVAIAIPMFVQTDVASMFLRGTRHFKTLALNGVAVTFIGALVVIPMVLAYGLDGAIWSIPIAAALSAVVSYRALQVEILRPSGFRSELSMLDKDMLLRLTRFGVVGSIMTVSRSFSDLLVRSVVVNSLGRAQNGYLQAAWGTGTPTMGLIISALTAYGVPTMAAYQHDRKVVSETRDDLIRFYLLTSIPLGAAYAIAIPIWLPLFYSRAFMPAERLAYLVIFGQLLYGLRMMINLGLVALERFTAALTLSLAQSAVFVLMFFIYLDQFGLMAAPLAFFVSDLVIMPASWLWAVRREAYEPSRRTLLLLASSLVYGMEWVIAPIYLGGRNTQIALMLGLIVWAAINMRRGDIERALRIVGRGRRRRKGGASDDSMPESSPDRLDL